MSYLKRVFKNAVANWANMGLSIAISFFLAPFILHKIGNTFYGVWAVVSQFTGYLFLLDFGVRDSVVRFVAEFHEKKNEKMLNDIINASLKLYFVIFFACIVVTLILAYTFPMIFKGAQETAPVAKTLIIIAGFDIAQTFVFNVFTGIVMGLQRYDVFSKISMVFTIIRASLTITLLSNGYGVVSIFMIQFICNSCTNIIIYTISRKMLTFTLDIKKYGCEKQIYKLLINHGSFVFLNNIAMHAFFFSSNFIIAYFLPISAVTYFAIATNLIDYMKRLIWAGTQAFTPLTSQLGAKNDPLGIITLLFKGSKFSLTLGLPVGIVYIFMGKQFIGLWMGSEYSLLTGKILAVLAVMTIFSLPHYTIGNVLTGLSKHRYMAYCRIIEGIANLSLSVILIKQIGVLGAAYGLAIPHLIMVTVVHPIIITRVVKVKLSLYIRSSYLGPMISIIPFAVACYCAGHFYQPHSLIVFFGEIFAMLPIYFVSVWFISITTEEHQLIKQLIDKYI